MKKFFYLDLRSLALARVMLGIVFLYDLAIRFSHREAFYTDYGVLPRKIYLENNEIPWKMTLFTLSGSVGFVEVMVAIGLIAGIMFTLGIRTKLSGFVCWILLMSFQSRNPFINHGGDNLLRMLLFWFMLLPTNAKYSFDLILSKKGKIEETEVSNTFSMCLILQVCFIYIFTTIYKIDSSWMTSFNSIYYALSLDMFTKPLGDFLVQFHDLGKFLTAFTMFIEAFGIIYLFIPYRNQNLRMLGVLLFLGLHIGIWTTFRLGTFASTCVIAWVCLIPGVFWEHIEKFFTSNHKIKIYFDRDCGFCIKMVQLIKTFLYLPNAEVFEAQSDKAINKDMEEKNSWVVLVDDKKYFGFNAIAKLIKISKLNFIYFPVLILTPIGNWIYSNVASNRTKMANIFKVIGYNNVRLDSGPIKKAFALFVLGLVFAWNVEGLRLIPKFDIRGVFDDIAFTLQLNQQWNMFAPSPMTGDGWFVADGVLSNGNRYDIFNDREYSEERPKALDEEYKDVHWQKYLLSLKFGSDTRHTLHFARYLCRKWNDNHSDLKVKTFKIHYFMELTPPMGKPNPAPQKITLWEHNCF